MHKQQPVVTSRACPSQLTATGAVPWAIGQDSLIVQLSICGPRVHITPTPSILRPGKYANSQSSLGATDIRLGGQYEVGTEITCVGGEIMNCFEDEKCRAVMRGCTGCAQNIMEDWDHSKGL